MSGNSDDECLSKGRLRSVNPVKGARKWGEKSCEEIPGSDDPHVAYLAKTEAHLNFRISMDKLHSD